MSTQPRLLALFKNLRDIVDRGVSAVQNLEELRAEADTLGVSDAVSELDIAINDLKGVVVNIIDAYEDVGDVLMG
jgi:hypothetical protein